MTQDMDQNQLIIIEEYLIQVSLIFSKSLCFKTDDIIQSKQLFPFNILYLDIGCFESIPFDQKPASISVTEIKKIQNSYEEELTEDLFNNQIVLKKPLYLDIGCFESIPFDQEFMLLFISLEDPVIINFSFGLVNATYKTLISSDKFSIFILLFNASFAILG